MKTRILTLYYCDCSTFNTVSNNILVGWPSTVASSGHFDQLNAADIYQSSNVDCFVVESTTTW